MSQQTAQIRSGSDKAGGSSAPGGGRGAFLGPSAAPSPGSKGLGELVPPAAVREKRENAGRERGPALYNRSARPGSGVGRSHLGMSA